MQDNKDKKSAFSSAIKKVMALPSDALVGEVRVELRGRRLLMVSGCRRILKYSEEEIVLATKDFCIRICGSHLQCTTYHYGSVSIEGEICNVGFGGEE